MRLTEAKPVGHCMKLSVIKKPRLIRLVGLLHFSLACSLVTIVAMLKHSVVAAFAANDSMETTRCTPICSTHMRLVFSVDGAVPTSSSTIETTRSWKVRGAYWKCVTKSICGPGSVGSVYHKWWKTGGL